MATVAIVAHSRAGNTWRLADAVCDGARIDATEVNLIRIGEDGVGFADTSIRAWRDTEWRDKLAGGFTTSTGMSGDKFSTLTYFWTLAMQQGMVWIGSGMKPAIAYDKAAPRDSLNYMGGYGGAMATNPFDDPQVMSPADLATAAAFGQRFATFLTCGKTPNTPYVDFTKS